MKRITILLIIIFLLYSCEKNINQSENLSAQSEEHKSNIASGTTEGTTLTNSKEESHTAKGEEWLTSVFKNHGSDKYFPDYNVEEKLCTKRYLEYIKESNEIYGASNLTEEERELEEIKFKEKWKGIYPIKEQENWLFGRGNGDIGELKSLKIKALGDLNYEIEIDYGNDIRTRNTVTLLEDKENFKIDYCDTEYF